MCCDLHILGQNNADSLWTEDSCFSLYLYLLQFTGKKKMTALKADLSQQFLFIWLCFLVYSKYLTFVIDHKSFAIILKSLLN